MKIDIEDIKAVSGKQKSLELSSAVELPSLEYPLLAPLSFKGFAENKGDYILVSGSVSFSLGMQCAACLKDIVYQGEAAFEEGYALEQELIDESGELDIHSYSGSEIVLDEELSAAILLALPMRLLCKEDCLGLCPHCGRDLNEGSCNCAADNIDPRLAILKAYKFDDSDKEV